MRSGLKRKAFLRLMPRRCRRIEVVPSVSDLGPEEVDRAVVRFFSDYQAHTGTRADRLALERRPWRKGDDILDELIRGNDDDARRAWPIILALIERSADSPALSYVGAGPLEDFLRMHGAAIGTLVADAARRDPRVREALGSVWGLEDVPEPMRSELIKLASTVQKA